MGLDWWRDLAVVLAGVMYTVLGLIVFAVVALIFWFARKGMKALHRLVQTRLAPVLDRGHGILRTVEGRTARFPGAPGSAAGITEVAGVVQKARNVKPPFRSRKRSWRPF